MANRTKPADANTAQQHIETPVTDTRDMFAFMYAEAKKEAGWDDFIGNDEKEHYAAHKTRLWITGARITFNERFRKQYLELIVRLEHGATGVWGGLHMAGPNLVFGPKLVEHFDGGGAELGPVVAVARPYTGDASGSKEEYVAYSFAPAAEGDAATPPPPPAPVADDSDTPF